MSSLLGEESTFPMPPSDGNKEESVMTIEENCSDTSPGVTVANEEFDDMHQKCGCCAYSNRRSNGNVTFWVLAILTVLVVAGGTLTAVILMSKNESTTNEAAENDGSLKQRSEAYYKERYEVFRQITGGVSTSEAQIQSDTPSSKALDWMVYKDTTIPHELLQQSNLDAASTLTQFNQRYAIMVLFYACGGEEWQGFVSDNIEQQGHIDTCLWDDDDFVACNDVHEIVELQLDFRRLGGTLPAELRVLTSLETLDISYNFLDGTVPDNLFQEMSNLKNLFLNNNEFIGNVPTSIGMATGLRNMDLSFNFFTGSLPAELATLPEIQRFSAKDNLLTGPFFEPFGAAWSQLEHLNLDGTQFTGTIPADVLTTWASSMIDLKLGFTQFHGRLPSEIGELSQLTGLNINGPKLQGLVPDLAKLTHLAYLTFEGSLITGTIPTSIGFLRGLQEVWFRFIGINGTIPTEIGMCTDLKKLILVGSALTGAIPTEIENFSSLKTLTLVENPGLQQASIPTGLCPAISSASITALISCEIECSCCIDDCVT